MLRQVEEHDYSPPRRDKISAWQQEQEFPIVPESDGVDAGNVYDDLKFPDRIYRHIADYYEDKANQ
ncbi:MAG: hypothetical protein WD314_03300 [Trueperaceae bacterium]